MEQGQIQKQEQELRQEQRLSVSVQQLLQAHLIELPINQFAERINTEMDDNPAVEVETPGDEHDGDTDTANYTEGDGSEEEDFYDTKEREERQSALDEALQNIGRDDEDLPTYIGGGNTTGEEREEMIYGSTISFYDQLREQIGEMVLTEKQRYIMEYLIGSLDDDGMLRKSTDSIVDELEIYHNIKVTEEEVEDTIQRLQEFEPAGIGARNLQECLLLQIDRRDESTLKELMHKVITKHFDAFIKKHWHKISASLKLTELQAEVLNRELCKLNPKPGAALGEAVGRNIQQITPDFIIDTHDDGTVTFTLNTGDVPELQVSQSFIDTMNSYRNDCNMSRQAKEALLYTRKKVAAAQGFIEAVKVRRRTLTVTMRAIIQWQHRFFEDGDEASLRPMNLKDIAEKTGLDISTISRVSNSKYAQTRWGIFPVRHFFSESYTTDSGEEMSTRAIKAAMREIVDSEDKKKPLNDDRLSEILAEKGFPIARRTVAKYREQMGIPVARLRKQ